ncbi:MAG: RusA family crossover junction endodeoxyribonuclease [bacterium]|nr:RusA family crossover junction endodeoxyribonuclease [bacterium]
MSKYFDFYFGLPVLVPSKQDDRESKGVSAFRGLVDRTVSPQVLVLPTFPSKKEIVVYVLQFFLSSKDYGSRDVDNMSKTVLDCLKGKLYVDDGQVRTLIVSKKMSPRVPNNFVFVALKELQGDTDIDVVKDKLLEQAVTLYQTSVKSSS